MKKSDIHDENIDLESIKEFLAKKYGHLNWAQIKNKNRKGELDVSDLIAFCDEANRLFYKKEIERLKGEREWISELTKALFWSKYEYSESCWLWNGNRNKDGYGTFRINDKVELSHRIAYSLITGIDIKEIDCVCHHCDNPACGNPKHLFHSDHNGNMKDKQYKFRGGGKLSKSKYMGVCWREDSKKWRAIIRIDGKYKSLGSFDSEIEAAKAYDCEFIKLFGLDKSYSKLNFPEPPNQ